MEKQFHFQQKRLDGTRIPCTFFLCGVQKFTNQYTTCITFCSLFFFHLIRRKEKTDKFGNVNCVDFFFPAIPMQSFLLPRNCKDIRQRRRQIDVTKKFQTFLLQIASRFMASLLLLSTHTTLPRPLPLPFSIFSKGHPGICATERGEGGEGGGG